MRVRIRRMTYRVAHSSMKLNVDRRELNKLADALEIIIATDQTGIRAVTDLFEGVW